jgi:hypothetical protein
MEKPSTFVVVVVLIGFLFLCGLVYACWYSSVGPGKRVMTHTESARNDDTSNFDNLLRF